TKRMHHSRNLTIGRPPCGPIGPIEDTKVTLGRFPAATLLRKAGSSAPLKYAAIPINGRVEVRGFPTLGAKTTTRRGWGTQPNAQGAVSYSLFPIPYFLSLSSLLRSRIN